VKQGEEERKNLRKKEVIRKKGKETQIDYARRHLDLLQLNNHQNRRSKKEKKSLQRKEGREGKNHSVSSCSYSLGANCNGKGRKEKEG